MLPSHVFTSLAGVDAGIVIEALHNHGLLIKTLCPALVSYTLESGDKHSSAVHTVTDKKPIGQIITDYFQTYHYQVSEGVNTLINANPPIGTLTISSKWRIMDSKLSEDIEIYGNFIMKKLAKAMLRRRIQSST